MSEEEDFEVPAVEKLSRADRFQRSETARMYRRNLKNIQSQRTRDDRETFHLFLKQINLSAMKKNRKSCNVAVDIS